MMDFVNIYDDVCILWNMITSNSDINSCIEEKIPFPYCFSTELNQRVKCDLANDLYIDVYILKQFAKIKLHPVRL